MAEEKSGGLSMYPRLQFAYLLQFAIWGSWNIALGALAAEKGFNPGALYSFFALGALFAPLIGPIADKKFAAQKVLAFMHLVGGLTLLYCHKVVSADVVNMTTLKALMFVAGLAYMPSIPLVNAVVFKHIPDKPAVSKIKFFPGSIKNIFQPGEGPLTQSNSFPLCQQIRNTAEFRRVVIRKRNMIGDTGAQSRIFLMWSSTSGKTGSAVTVEPSHVVLT